MTTVRRTTANEPETDRRVRRGEACDWTSCNAERLQSAVAAVAERGGALRLGYSRSRDAFAVGVLGDGKPYTDYLQGDADVDGYLADLIEAWTR